MKPLKQSQTNQVKERDHDGVINRESWPERTEGQEARESRGGESTGVAAPCATCEATLDAQTPGDHPSHTGHPPCEGAGDAKPVEQAHLPRRSLLLSDLGWG